MDLTGGGVVEPSGGPSVFGVSSPTVAREDVPSTPGDPVSRGRP